MILVNLEFLEHLEHLAPLISRTQAPANADAKRRHSRGAICGTASSDRGAAVDFDACSNLQKVPDQAHKTTLLVNRFFFSGITQELPDQLLYGRACTGPQRDYYTSPFRQRDSHIRRRSLNFTFVFHFVLPVGTALLAVPTLSSRR